MATTDIDWSTPLSQVLNWAWRWQILLVLIIHIILGITYIIYAPDEWVSKPNNNVPSLYSVALIMCSRFNPVNVLMHSGCRIKLPLLKNKITVFPRFAPSTCAAAAKVAGGSPSVWPCQRDALLQWCSRLRSGDDSLRELLLDDGFSAISGFVLEVAFLVVFVVWELRLQPALIKRLKQRRQDGHEVTVLDAAALEESEGGCQDVKEALDIISGEATMA